MKRDRDGSTILPGLPGARERSGHAGKTLPSGKLPAASACRPRRTVRAHTRANDIACGYAAGFEKGVRRKSRAPVRYFRAGVQRETRRRAGAPGRRVSGHGK